MNSFARLIATLLFAGVAWTNVFSQSENLPPDYLSNSFHAGRRQALRELMAPNSVMVIFAYPQRVFSNDVDYTYHPNPDLYYFSGYREPNAVLLIFKDMQPDGDSSYSELFFVQHRDPRAEQWTGRRLGVDGVKSQLGFKRVYNGEEFARFPIDLKKFNLVYDILPDTSGSRDPGSLQWLVSRFVNKADVKPIDNKLNTWLGYIYQSGNSTNLTRLLSTMKIRVDSNAYKNEPLIQELIAHPDSASLQNFKKAYKEYLKQIKIKSLIKNK